MNVKLKYLLPTSLLVLILLSTYFLFSPLKKTTIVVVGYNTRLTSDSSTWLDYKKYNIYHIINTSSAQAVKTKAILSKAKAWEKVDNVEDYQQVSTAMHKLKIHRIDYLLTAPKEVLIENASKLRKQFNVQHGMRPDIAIPFVNKRIMKEKLKQHNIPQTPFISDINQAQKTFGFPLVLKPIDKDGSKGIFIIKDHKALQNALTKIKAQNRTSYYIAEKYIHGHDYMINAIVLNETIQFVMAVKFIDKKFDFYRKGKPYSFITVDSAEKRELEELARQVIKKLGLKNSGMFLDCIKDQATGKFLISEVACRVGGGAYKNLIKKQCGVDMQSEGYRAQLGIPLKLSRNDEIPDSQVLGAVSFPSPRNWVADGVNTDNILFRIEQISPASFGQNLNTFYGYLYDFGEKSSLPLKDDQLFYSDSIKILLKGKDRISLRKDIATIKANFILTFYPWMHVYKDGVWEQKNVIRAIGT